MKPAAKFAAYVLVIALIVGLRLYRLSADPPTWLSWSSGIYSDEGIYASDARSVVLFGHWAPGDFHSAVVVPIHTLLLLGVFRLFGVSLHTTRVLSSSTSLLTLFLLYFALKRTFNERTAFLAVILLGLSPVYAFYNRLGLLETPALLILTAALLVNSYDKTELFTGVLLALAVAYKPVALLCVPAFFVEFNRYPVASARKLAGLTLGLTVFFFAWQLPHNQELAQINRYYLLHQYLARSFAGVGHNIVRSLWSGSSDGLVPYLVRNALLLLLLAIGAAVTKKTSSDRRLASFLVWLALPCAAFCLISYAPSRYFVLLLLPLAVIAAVYISVLSQTAQAILVFIYTVISVSVIVCTLTAPTYLVENAARQLSRATAPRETVIGQYAPELSLDNQMICMYVQPGLANTRGSIEGDTVLVTRSPYWDSYWFTRLPSPVHRSLPSLTLPKEQIIDVYETR